MYTQIIGPCCSGKTSLARSIAVRARGTVYTEPTDKATTFPLFVKDPVRYAFVNQIEFMLLTLQHELAIASSQAPYILQDSGLFTCHYVYNHFFKDQLYLSENQFQCLEDLFATYSKVCRRPDGVLFLYAPKLVLLAREKKRDGNMLHNFDAIYPYWIQLKEFIETQNIPLLSLDTARLSDIELYEEVKAWTNTLPQHYVQETGKV
ncbi:MAG TPA: deoxynucleoside kinase [Ktedonobacteraceae bacterium]|nr:deoxynucleoside kinase [Ktedonobacteraceae bacterium]